MRYGGAMHRFVTWLLALLWAGTANAQPADPQARFNQAVELATGGNYDKAAEACLDVLDRLPESERPRVHKLLGYSYMKLDMLPESWHHLTICLESSGKEDTSAVGWLQEVESALKKTHVKVSFSCHPADASIRLPSSRPTRLQVSMPCPISWWVKPGKHLVKGTAPGHKSGTVEINVTERGDSGMREIRLAAVETTRPPDGGGAGSGSGGTTIVKPTEPKKPSRGLEWALIGSGLALGVTGVIFHGIGYSKNEDLHDRYLDTADYPDGDQAKKLYDEAYQEEVGPKKTVACICYGVGGAAVLAGVITWAVRKPGEKESGAAGLTVAPLAFPGGTGALVSLEF